MLNIKAITWEDVSVGQSVTILPSFLDVLLPILFVADRENRVLVQLDGEVFVNEDDEPLYAYPMTAAATPGTKRAIELVHSIAYYERLRNTAVRCPIGAMGYPATNAICELVVNKLNDLHKEYHNLTGKDFPWNLFKGNM